KSCDEAKKRPAAADALAMNTNMSVEDAKVLLAKMPEEGVAAEAKPTETNAANPDFKAAMDGARPGPGAGDGKDKTELTEEQKDAAVSKRILAARFGESAAN